MVIAFTAIAMAENLPINIGIAARANTPNIGSRLSATKSLTAYNTSSNTSIPPVAAEVIPKKSNIAPTVLEIIS